MVGVSRNRRSDPNSPRRGLSTGRAQSETIGVLLMTGVVILLVATIGFAMTSNVMSQMETGPQITIKGEATQDDLTIQHAGGAKLEVSELDVVLRGDSIERHPLSSFTQRRGSNATWFESGDRWQREHGLSGDSAEILIVHTPSGTVVGRTTLELQSTGPFFEVDITGTNSPVEQGDSLDVDVEVKNTGIETGTQDLEISFDGDIEESESVTLSPSQRTSRTFTLDTSAVDPGTYTVAASTDNRSDERTVTVEEPKANITIIAVEGMSNETTTHSYQPTVTVTESAGVETDGLQVEFIIDEQDTNVTAFEELRPLNEIKSESLTVDFDVGQLEANNYNYFATASADNAITDSQSEEFVVGEPPFFDVTIESTNSPINTGDTLRVDTRVENTGSLEGTQEITLDVNGHGNSRDVTLAPGENRTITLEWQTSGGDQGTYTATVRSDDDSDSVEVTVETGPSQPPSVRTESATDIDASSATLNGDLRDLGTADEVEVFFEYREVGESDWTETTRRTKSETGEFSEVISGLDSNTEYEFRAVANSASGRDEGATNSFTTGSAPVEPFLSNLNIAGQGADATISEGDDEDVSADVENVGNQNGAFDVTLKIEDSDGVVVVDETQENVAVSAGETETVIFEIVTGDLATGDYSVEVSTEDDSVTGTLTVEETRDSFYPTGFVQNAGTVSNFENMQADDGEVAEFRGSSPPQGNPFNIDIETGAIPAGNYDLEIQMGAVGVQGQDTISVTIESEDGTVSRTAEIDETDANGLVTIEGIQIDSEQEITVNYGGDRRQNTLDVDFQRFVEN